MWPSSSIYINYKIQRDLASGVRQSLSAGQRWEQDALLPEKAASLSPGSIQRGPDPCVDPRRPGAAGLGGRSDALRSK